ncbi:MAG: cyclic nucleotide-binding domain-containing protein [Anaerolineaceae bacterium]|nr:cyclic nucleotide-binding domain-containing protein [Anaerolineaceae bacterium]
MSKRHLFSLPVFQGTSVELQAKLTPLVTLCHIAAGTTIFKQGEAANYLFILEKGQVEIVFKPFDGPALLVSRLGKGDIFGWSSTLGRKGYTSAAQALCDCEAYRMSGKDLQRLCENDPQSGVVILDRLASAIAERLECTHTEIMGILNQGMNLDLDLHTQGSNYG